jgi:hypothetical protein
MSDDSLKMAGWVDNPPLRDYTISLRKVEEKIDILHKEGYRPGYDCGFANLYEYYSVIPGKMTFLVGSPAHGKTYFWFECLINLAQFHDLRHLIFTPEMGNAHEVYADLMAMYVGVKFQLINHDLMDEAKTFIDKHFVIIDPGDNRFTIEDWFNQAEIEKAKGGRVDTLTGDPFNEFIHDFKDDYNRQDLYIERILGMARRKAETLDVHCCIITHAKDQVAKEKDGIRYYPPPMAREYAGGQSWYRKGLAMICVWRPPDGLTDDHGISYMANETHLIIQKAKPRGVGKTGLVKLYLDMDRWRYYEESTFGGRQYGRKLRSMQDVYEQNKPEMLFGKSPENEKAPF